jgi:outer membrane protein OmpA-like peptidoglycan-associated protein
MSHAKDTMKRPSSTVWTLVRRSAIASIGLSTIACAATPPPKELVEARSSYTIAQKGIAAKLAPADLDTAKQALDRAEHAFEKDPEAPIVRDLAYVAERQARMAEANGAIEAAKRRRTDADRAYKDATQQQLQLARERLASGEEALADEKRAREQAEKERASAEQARAEAEKARLATEKELKAALQSMKEIAQVKEEARGVVITLSGAVLFASGKSELLPIAREKLDQVADSIKDQGNKKLVVEGHTDSVGPRNVNMKLGQDRADAVRNHLIARGIPAGSITAVGVGPDRPVADNNSAEGRANNRRVEIIVK